MKLSKQTQTEVQSEIRRLRLVAAHYSRCAIVARWRKRREQFEADAQRFEHRMRALTMALDFGGVQ